MIVGKETADRPVGIKHAFVHYNTHQLVEFIEAELAQPYLNDPQLYEAAVRKSCDRNGLALDLPRTTQGWEDDLAAERAKLIQYVTRLKNLLRPSVP